MEIASNFTSEDYKELRPTLDPDDVPTPEWERIIGAFERRVSERFLRPIDELLRASESEIRAGFAILTLDCVLIDMIESFREGRTSTGEGTAKSFKKFLTRAPFQWGSSDRRDFFKDVRNGLLHDAETRGNWLVRKSTDQILTKTSTERIINRTLFHGGVEKQFRDLVKELESKDPTARKKFLLRMDTICGMPSPVRHTYFAYGSNMAEPEIRASAPNVEDLGAAVLPLYRLLFDKHSVSRDCDAANLARDPVATTWGYLYRCSASDWKAIEQREGGYKSSCVTVFTVSDEGVDKPVVAETFIADRPCSSRCGPSSEYVEIIVAGAKQRGLPDAYVRQLEKTAESASGH